MLLSTEVGHPTPNAITHPIMLVCPTLAIQHCMILRQGVVQRSMGVKTYALFRTSHTVQLSVDQLSFKHSAGATCMATNPQPTDCSTDNGVNRHCVLRHLTRAASICLHRQHSQHCCNGRRDGYTSLLLVYLNLCAPVCKWLVPGCHDNLVSCPLPLPLLALMLCCACLCSP
jgi:hypothetical protein